MHALRYKEHAAGTSPKKRVLKRFRAIPGGDPFPLFFFFSLHDQILFGCAGNPGNGWLCEPNWDNIVLSPRPIHHSTGWLGATGSPTPFSDEPL
jgi:hypothetical protein